MPTHHPGLVVTDVTVVTCSSVNVFSSCDLDPEEWHRIDKDLYLGKAWTSQAYLYISRKHEEDLTDEDSVVMDVAVGKMHPKSHDGSDTDEQWESRPAGIWVKRSAKKHASDSAHAVTDRKSVV